MAVGRWFLLLPLIGLFSYPGHPRARTWHIEPGGEGDAPTIQAGLDSASAGDTVLVACGTYYEHDVEMKSGVVLRSATGEPDCAMIDSEQQSRCLTCMWCDNATVIEGLTMTGGRTRYPIGYGGGVRCEGSATTFRKCIFTANFADAGGGVASLGGSPKFEDCIFSENEAGDGGGALCTYSSPEFVGCLFSRNWALVVGGGLFCEVQSLPLVSGCTFYGNAAGQGGGGIGCFEESSPMLRNTVIAFSSQGEAIWRAHDDCNPLLFCCDLYGNEGGNWTDFIQDQIGHHGNFQQDPLFCDVSADDLTIAESSPCLPGNHPGGYVCGDVVGCYGQGCISGGSTEPATWGLIKSRYHRNR